LLLGALFTGLDDDLAADEAGGHPNFTDAELVADHVAEDLFEFLLIHVEKLLGQREVEVARRLYEVVVPAWPDRSAATVDSAPRCGAPLPRDQVLDPGVATAFVRFVNRRRPDGEQTLTLALYLAALVDRLHDVNEARACAAAAFEIGTIVHIDHARL